MKVDGPVRPASAGGGWSSADTRLPALDGIRGLAIGLVIVYHAFQYDDPQPIPADRFLFDLAGVGWSGVDLFFVLSGFLITGILLDSRERGHYFRNFYGRRFLRIFPLYYSVLFLFSVGGPILSHPRLTQYVEKSVGDQVWFWMYLTNFRIAERGEWYGRLIPDVLWSLAIEEQFYLVWPLVVLMCTTRTLVAICLGLMAVALAIRVTLALALFEPIVNFVLTFTRMDGLALGALLAVLARGQGALNRAVWWARRSSPALVLALGGGAVYSATLDWRDPFMNTVGISLLALLYGAVLVMAVKGNESAGLRRFFEARFMRMLGKYSYAMYLFHGPAGSIVTEFYAPGGAPLIMGSAVPRTLLFTFLMGSLSLLTAWVSWHALERHFIALQRHFRSPMTAARPSPS